MACFTKYSHNNHATVCYCEF